MNILYLRRYILYPFVTAATKVRSKKYFGNKIRFLQKSGQMVLIHASYLLQILFSCICKESIFPPIKLL